MALTKSGLAIELSRIMVFDNADIKLEQYPTDSEIAATVLWDAFVKGDIEDKIIADLGAGTGILGIGALLLGAKFVSFIEKDPGAVHLLRINLAGFDEKKYEIVAKDINDFSDSTDVVIQNPPFGTKEKHADIEFLNKAFLLSDIIYSFHKTSTLEYIKQIVEKNRYNIDQIMDFRFPLKQTQAFHKRKIHRIDVSCLRLLKKQ